MIPVTELEMAASNTFSSIINEIQLSNLNFSISMTPFAAYITLKKTVRKNINGVYATPAPPLLCLFQQSQGENRRLQVEISKLKAAVDTLEEKYENAIRENLEHLEYSEETNKTNLHTRVDNAEREAKKNLAEISKLERKLKENKKKRTAELNNLQCQIKDLKTERKLKKKKNHDLKRNLQNVHDTLKEYKAEKSQCKTKNTRLEAEIRKLQSKLKKDSIDLKNMDINANLKETRNETMSIASVTELLGSFAPSLVSHCYPPKIKIPQSPSSTTSMIAHCAVSSRSRSSSIDITEALEALNKAIEKLSASMKW